LVSILALGTRIAPFGDAVGEVPLLGRSLDRFREEEVRFARVDGGRFTFADYAIATAPILAAFERKVGTKRSRPSALALPSRSPSAHLAPVSSVRRDGDRLIYDIFLDAPKDAPLEDLRRIASPVVADLPGAVRVRELPRVGPEPHAIELPADGVVSAHVEHWVHVLWLAPLLVPALAQRIEGRRRRWRRALAGSVIGRGAEIHPSAFLEGAVIGEGAIVGARCSIRHSYVGPRSNLGDFTKVTSSVIGEGTHTLADGNFFWVVGLGGGTITSFLLKDTLLGKNVFLTSGVIFWNESIEGTIAVLHRGGLVDTGRKCLGGCAGHGAVLGARTIVAPGRALPNRTTVVMRREEGVLRIEDVAPGTPMCWSDAAMVPVERVLPGYVPDELIG
jgi:hypothetical protein